tara:strand:+ start:10620 stop:10994 length:375 start_codon:yes stop_codon:yes gene_type:complete
MKITLLSILLLLIQPVAAYDDCYRLVTQNYTRDSAAYALSEFDIVSEAQAGSAQYASDAVMQLEAKLGCELEGDLLDRIYSTECRNIDDKYDTSRICFVKTEYGYYFVSVDMLGNVNIIFSRFD